MSERNTKPEISISQHCLERYAERVMDRHERNDAAVFAAQHKDKIIEEIRKMYEYGDLIYSGVLQKGNKTDVYVNGSWILLVDPDKHKAITLYKVDLRLDEDFNKQYMKGMLENIDNARIEYEKAKETVKEKQKEYTEYIGEMTEKVNEYKHLQNVLQKEIDGYKALLKDVNAEAEDAEEAYRQAVLDLTMKREF